jgi:tetratricopeptide (TPR) repeat protein
MRGNRIAILLLIFLARVVPACAQESEQEKLGLQYYEQGQFAKAAETFEAAWNKQPTDLAFNYYLNSLIGLKEYAKLEKFLKRCQKKEPSNIIYKIKLGMVYIMQVETKKAEKIFRDAINALPPDQGAIIALADAFESASQFDYAIETYERGQQLMLGIYSFNFEMAEVYQRKGDISNTIAQYLEALRFSEAYLTQVQNALQTTVGEDTKGEKKTILKTELLKKIQQIPDKIVYADMLIWLFIQDRNFDAAFDQSVALDKRLGGTSGKVMSLGALATSNLDFEAATRCYDYELKKGKSNPYYSQALTEFVQSMNSKLAVSLSWTVAQAEALRQAYEDALNDLGRNAATLELQKGLAHVQAFYLNRTQDARAVLQQALLIPGADARSVAQCKLELGDIELFDGDPWEASLLFSQVEKAFKQEPIGQEAKFRNARLSYYKGDFEWAQAQLTVLKAATSKLIANDALELSLIITDNLGKDSIAEPLLIYSRADLLAYQNLDSLCLLTLDSLVKAYPEHSLQDEVLYKKATLASRRGRYQEAVTLLTQLTERFSDDVLGDNATFLLGDVYETRLNDTEKAKAAYETLLLKYPGSTFTVEARKRFRKLRGDTIN